MITPYVVFWVLWLVGLVFGSWLFSPWEQPNRRYFGANLMIWIMFALLGIMAKGSPFAGW